MYFYQIILQLNVLEKNRESKNTVYRKVRSLKNYKKIDFTALLRVRLSDSGFDTLNDPNDKWKLFYDSACDLLSIMCPYKMYRQREIVTPWINADICRNIRYRNSLVNLYKITKNKLYLNLMRQQHNTVNSMIDSAKKAYINALLENNTSCPKKFWKVINQFLKGDYGTAQKPSFIDPMSKEEISRDDEPDFLNEYFCDISARLGFDCNDRVDYADNNYMNIYENVNGVYDLQSDLITVEEILTLADDIDLTKSSSIEGITSEICKDLILQLPELFVSMYNASTITHMFPAQWSKGTVIVIPKGGDLSNPANWRPITQTPIFAKIMEKIVHRRMSLYFLEQNILTPYQYGFRQGRSTQQAAFDLLKYIYSGLNHKKVVGSVCLDVAKAFDCINHDILLFKLRKIGFSENSIAWFKSYLTRTQVVKFDNTLSSQCSIITGIGQGTILGPLLFIFYINDLTTVIHNLKINMYADDCILYNSGNNWTTMLQKMQPEIDRVQHWCVANRLKINESKSKVLLFASHQKLSKIDFSRIYCWEMRP